MCHGTKERILVNSHDTLKKELYVTDFLRHLRTTEGLLREKLDIDNDTWERAMHRFSYFETTADKVVLDSKNDQCENNKNLSLPS